MAGTKYGSFAVGDANLDNLMLFSAGSITGYQALTLTEMATTTVPKIAAGSKLEIGGSLYIFNADETISTTDPVTSATVADGTVFIMINPTTILPYFTATEPTWSDTKQGWYGIGTYAGWRYLDYTCNKSTSIYYKFKNTFAAGLYSYLTTQILPVSVNTKLNANTLLPYVKDTWSMADAINSRIYIKKSGYYSVNVVAQTTGSIGYYIYVSGSLVATLGSILSGSPSQFIMSAIIPTFIGDYIEIYALSASGSTNNAISFSVIRIGD